VSQDVRTVPTPAYEAMLHSAALLDETEQRTLIRVEGDRARETLHGLTTNDVNQLPVNRALYAFMLTPKGRPVAEMRLLCLAAEFWLDIPAACRASALAHLRKYVPPIHASVAESPVRRIGILGPLAGAVIDGWAGERVTDGLAPLECRVLDPAAAHLVAREPIEAPGYDLYVVDGRHRETMSALTAAAEELGGQRIGPEAWTIRRVERGIPQFGVDFGEENLAQETGQDDRAISFDKGCYTGQEVVARIHFRGHVNRILRGFRFPSAPLPPGTALFVGERQRARVTSIAESPRFGSIGLGLARADIAPGSLLSRDPDGEPEIELTELPFERAP